MPVAGRGQGSAYAKFSHPASRYAVVGAAALVTIENGMCSAARVALGGLVPNARRLPAVERALIGKPPSADTIAAAARLAADDLGDDVSGRYLRVGRVPRGDGAGLRQARARGGRRAREPGS